MKKIIPFLIGLMLMVGIVTAFQFIAPNKLDFTYNPYTYKNQYLRSSNFSGENLTTDCINADDGTFYVDCANHRVGIGTTTPSQTLSVVGTLNVTSWTYTAGEYKCDNGTHTIRARNKTLLNDMGCSI